jgi:hypothetical protein
VCECENGADIMESKGPLFESAYEQLSIMENEKKVDLSILKIFGDLNKSFIDIEKQWKISEDIPIGEAFLLFHSIRNCRSILEKMAYKFIRAKEMQQNPRVVYSALLVLPQINDVYNLVDTIGKSKISELSLNMLRQKLRMLRDVADNNSMLPSPSEELKGVLKGELRKKFQIVVEDLQATICEESDSF